MVFGCGNNLYVNFVANSDPVEPLLSGILKVNVTDGSYTQFWGSEELSFPGGLTRDRKGNFYVADINQGIIYKVNRCGRGKVWLDDPLLKDPTPDSPFPVGVNGIVYDECDNAIYAANFSTGALLKIPIKKCGCPGRVRIIIQDDQLIGIDQLNLGFEKDTIYSAVLNTQSSIRIDLKRRTYTVLADNLGSSVQTLPIGDGEFLVSNLGSVDFPGGNIWRLKSEVFSKPLNAASSVRNPYIKR
jgi:DNA-binding beta-propeller fold protein YncE